MLARCYRATDNNFHRYGAKGISVCDQWRNSFENFLSEMGMPPTPRHTLDRFPNKTGNYEPSNCRWADKVEQANNLTSNKLYEHDGKKLTVPAWSRLVGVPEITIKKRLQAGISFDRAISRVNLRYGSPIQSLKRRSVPD